MDITWELLILTWDLTLDLSWDLWVLTWDFTLDSGLHSQDLRLTYDLENKRLDHSPGQTWTAEDLTQDLLFLTQDLLFMTRLFLTC